MIKTIKVITTIVTLAGMNSCGQPSSESQSELKTIYSTENLSTLKAKKTKDGTYFEYCFSTEKSKGKRCEILNDKKQGTQNTIESSYFNAQELEQFTLFLEEKRAIQEINFKKEQNSFKHRGSAALVGIVMTGVSAFASLGTVAWVNGIPAVLNSGFAINSAIRASQHYNEIKKIETISSEVSQVDTNVGFLTLLDIKKDLEKNIEEFKNL